MYFGSAFGSPDAIGNVCVECNISQNGTNKVEDGRAD